MIMGAKAHAKWELDVSNNILGDKKRLVILALLTVPIMLGGIAFADQIGETLPKVLGGKKAYSPAFYSTFIFTVSILIGMVAGLITGCIGAGGGFVIAPALMSAGIKGILAVGTDLFHIFAKAIMGSVIHRKLGNVSVPLAVVFLLGAMIGATAGGVINRVLYELNPVLSDAFITTVYSLMLGFLGLYALADFLKDKGHYLRINQMYQEKRDFFLNLIKDSRFTFKPSSGSYFQLLDYSRITDEKDIEFAVRMTKEHRVASIPVSVFYPDEVDNKVLRFCFAKKEETLEKAAEILCQM